MIMKNINRLLAVAALLPMMICCESGEPEFDDFDYQTVYFASQTPVRTVELGNDEQWDLTDDNAHRVHIKATMGGSYGNKNDIVIDYAVDESLCDNLFFENGGKVMPLPTSYYSLASNQLLIPKGQILGGVQVELKDAFFNDPLSLSNNYVIPLRMKKIVQGADSILEGKDYILYALKYINPWHAHYLRRGIDQVSIDGATQTVNRHSEYVENDEQVYTYTRSYLETVFPVTYTDKDGRNYTVNLNLTFSADGSCTVSSLTANVTASGSGRYVTDGEKYSFGGKDRDGLYLNYEVRIPDRNTTYQTADTLVMHYRGVTQEHFNAVEQQ
jgi:hypothetical protein